LNSSGKLGQGKVLGKVEKKEAKVRRKSASSYVWNNVQLNEDLYRKDSIQTGKGSATSVRLADGSVLDIGEDSLVMMDDAAQLSVNFLRGSVVVHKKEGDTKVSVGKDGKTVVEELSIRLLKPDSLAQFYVPEKTKKVVLFDWDPRKSTGNEIFTIQVSTDKRFSPQVTQTFDSPDSKSRSMQLQLAAGRYFWRILLKSKVMTETRGFRISAAVPLQPVYPAHQQKVTTLATDVSVPFRWVAPRLSASDDLDLSRGEHHIEISTEPSFKSAIPSDNLNLQLGMATLSQVPPGRVYWRIRSVYGDLAVVSETRSFELQKVLPAPSPTPTPTPSAPPTLPYPITTYPPSGAALHLLDRKKSDEIFKAAWKEVEGAEEYEITVFAESGQLAQRKVVLHKITSKTQIALKELKVGDYSWTLRAIDSRKRPGESMPLLKFKVDYGAVLPAPKIVSPEVQ